jgi:sec-independent protein translocase protein TatA
MGMGELIVVLIVVLLVFGANRIPALGDGLGRAIRNFRKSVSEDPAIDVTPRTGAAPEAPPAPPARLDPPGPA